MGSRRSTEMQTRLADTFMNLVVENPRKRVTVTSLVEAAQVDRKSFYHYFENTSDLIIWIYRTAVDEALRDPKMTVAEAVYPHPISRDKYQDLICYGRIRNFDGSLDQAAVFQTLLQVKEKHTEYYSQLFTSSLYIDFYRYLIKLYLPIIRQDIEIICGSDQKLPDAVLDFLAEYHTFGIWGRVQYHFTIGNRQMRHSDLMPYWNYAHLVIKQTGHLASGFQAE